MQTRRVPVFLSLLMIAALLVVAGCAPRAGSGEIAEVAGDDGLVIDMPALVLSFGDDGKASMGDVPLADLVNQAAPGALDSLVIPADQIDFLKSSNIQHVQINNRTGGLNILVNGEPIPSLEWDGDTLVETAGLLNSMGMSMPLLEKVLPMVRQLGIAVVARFPTADGAAEIPLIVEGEGSSAAMAKAAVDSYLTSVGNLPPKVRLPVFYNDDGTWTVNGLTDTEWTALTQGQIPWQELRMLPSALENAKAAGISTLTISTDAAGLSLGINGNSLPTIGWSNGELNHLIKIAQQAGLLDSLGDATALIPTIEALLPMVQATDMEIEVHFPG